MCQFYLFIISWFSQGFSLLFSFSFGTAVLYISSSGQWYDVHHLWKLKFQNQGIEPKKLSVLLASYDLLVYKKIVHACMMFCWLACGVMHGGNRSMPAVVTGLLTQYSVQYYSCCWEHVMDGWIRVHGRRDAYIYWPNRLLVSSLHFSWV